MRITIKNIALVGDAYKIVVAKDLKNSANVSFALTEQTRYEMYLEALAGATKRAREKAEVMAAALGIQGLTPKSVMPYSNPYYVYPYHTSSGNGGASGNNSGGGSYPPAPSAEAPMAEYENDVSNSASTYINIVAEDIYVSASVTVLYIY